MLDLLAVAAHPDDMEILAGGLLALVRKRGGRTGILDLTRGERGSNGSAASRKKEWEKASKVLGLSVRRNLGLPDSAVEDDLKSRRKLAQEIRALRPALVVTMPPDDHHPDHVAAAKLVSGACWLSGLRKAPGLKGAPFRPKALLHAVGHRQVEPGLIVDVSGVWATKREAMLCYRSQFTGKGKSELTFIDRPGFLEMLEARAKVLGFRIGATYGEAFLLKGPLVVKDPLSVLSAGAAGR